MFAVEIYAAVRRLVFVEGKSRREAARVFRLSRDTISKMCRYSAPPESDKFRHVGLWRALSLLIFQCVIVAVDRARARCVVQLIF
jgi:hypothetical protein